MTNSTQQPISIEPDERAEEYLASLLVRDRDARELIVDAVTLPMFATEPARSILSAVIGLMVEQVEVDEHSLTDRLGNMNDSAGMTVALCKQNTVSPENASHYIKRVRENFQKRCLLDILASSQQQLLAGVDEFDEFKAGLEDSLLRDLTRTRPEPETCVRTVELIEEAKAKGGLGYSWGLKRLDELTGGIIPGRYYAIGGLKKTGKSLFGVHTISELAGSKDNPIPCLIISLEMSSHQLNRAFISRQAMVDSRLFGTRYLSKAQVQRCREAASAIDRWPRYIVDSPGMTIEQILATIRRYVRRGVKVVLIDYLQRIDIPNRNDSRATAIQKAVNQLADATRKYDIALLLLSQLANRAEFSDEPMVSDFKESGGIAEGCDCALMLHNFDRAKKEGQGVERKHLMAISVPVQRVGISGRTVYAKHDLRVARFYEWQLTKRDDAPEEKHCETCGHSIPEKRCETCGHNIP